MGIEQSFVDEEESGFSIFKAASMGEIAKRFGWLGFLVLLLGAGFAASWIFGNKTLMLLCGFGLLSIPIRVLDIGQDAFWVEGVATFGLLLALTTSPLIAAGFSFGIVWITRLTSPNGPIEEITDTICISVSYALACLCVPIMTNAMHSTNLIYLMLIFQVVRFVSYYAAFWLVSPGTFFTELVNGPLNLAVAVFCSYLILLLIAGHVLGFVGIQRWSVDANILEMIKAIKK